MLSLTLHVRKLPVSVVYFPAFFSSMNWITILQDYDLEKQQKNPGIVQVILYHVF